MVDRTESSADGAGGGESLLADAFWAGDRQHVGKLEFRSRADASGTCLIGWRGILLCSGLGHQGVAEENRISVPLTRQDSVTPAGRLEGKGSRKILLLSRGPSHRLSAEMMRDTALAASGLLDDKLGGPPVSPYMPGDLWRESQHR